MPFAGVGGTSIRGGYAIDNSLRFNDGDSPKLALSFSPLYTFSSGTWSLWLKRSHLGTDQYFFSSHVQGPGDNKGLMLRWTNDYKIRIQLEDGNNYLTWETSALFRDVSAWYHIHVTYSGTNIMDESYWTLKVNGVTQSGTVSKSGSQSTITLEGFSISGRYSNSIAYLDGYATEYYFIDGSVVDVSNFAEADTDSGIWKPKEYTGIYGSKGFYLDFENSGSLGADQSGNGNNFTPTNLASTDQTTDTPTNNFATINALQKTSGSQLLSEGNLEHRTTGNWMYLPATFGASSGKWYAEIKLTDASNFNVGVMQLGGASDTTSLMNTNNTILGSNSAGDAWALYGSTIETGTYKNNNTPNFGNISTGFVGNWSNNDIAMIALDTDNQKIWFGRNGSWDNSGDPVAGTNPMPVNTSMIAGKTYTFASGPEQGTQQWNFGSPPFSISSGNSDGNGYGNFEYAPPTGFLALCTQNLATELSPTIDDGSQYFNTILWTGSGTSSSRSLTGVGFQPDWTWIKPRTSNPNATHHQLYDSNRGTGKSLRSSSTDAEITNSAYGYLSSFDSDGFSSVAGVNNNENINETGATFVAWNWKANAGSTSSNTDGSITSTVQANTTAGFSIVLYTGNATAGATIGHGLGVKPDMIIVKPRNNTANWLILHKAYEGTSAENMRFTTMALASADSQASSGWYRTAPTSSVFYVGNGVAGDFTSSTNQSGANHVAYCFAEIEGYSKFGKYTGNGSTDGTFVYTGFRPAFVLFKSSSIAGENWVIQDSTRDSYNLVYHRLDAERSNAEFTNIGSLYPNIDILSNGFKLRGSGNVSNGSGATYIYMAFAENPFVSSTGIPVVAR